MEKLGQQPVNNTENAVQNCLLGCTEHHTRRRENLKSHIENAVR
jgi:hypothetical protein